MPKDTKGKLIVIYGINNLGKSTQAKLLVSTLNERGYVTEYLKYPIYNLEPTGPEINKILRGGGAQKISEVDLQRLYAQNRFDYQSVLSKTLAQGIHVVAEDYTGTGIAWGVTKGAMLEVLEQINQGLLVEDIAILLDGERFLEGKESDHLHERDDNLMHRCRQTHLDLAKRYHWRIIPANGSIEAVKNDIWELMLPLVHNPEISKLER